MKKQFAGKVKLIYIDPPYNTGGDANIFTYNNTFNHSTWLTFMRNRLEIAKELLRNDGFIAIAIDHCELGYILVLSDEIFGRENRLGIITVLHNPKGRNLAEFFSENSEFMLVFAKNKDFAKFEKVAISNKTKETFNLRDATGNYRLDNFMRVRHDSTRDKKSKFFYPIYVSSDLKKISLTHIEDSHEIFPIDNKGKQYSWKTIPSTFATRNKNGEYIAKMENNRVTIYNKYIEQEVIKNVWIDKKYQSEFNGTNLLKKILRKNIFSYPKSLYTVLDTLKLTTDKDDIILDFFAGSGTTGHAALSLNKEDGGNRKFILIEQLDNHIDVCNERIKKVMQQENINASFVYYELAKWNETAKEKILASKSLEELEGFFDEMYERYFLNYNLKNKEFKEKILQETNFRNLSLDEQKSIFIAMLDNNQIYVNETEMADKKFSISAADQKLTSEFHSGEE